MSDMSPVIVNQTKDIAFEPWDSLFPGAYNYENLGIGTNILGGATATTRFDFMSFSVTDPSISMRIMQLAVAANQQQWSMTVLSLKDNIHNLTREMESLKEEIRHLCSTRTFVVPITTLTPKPFRIVHQLPVTIEGDGEDFTATFTEANVSASGETEADAIANFKEALVSSYEMLEEIPANEMGALPARKWSILSSALERCK